LVAVINKNLKFKNKNGIEKIKIKQSYKKIYNDNNNHNNNKITTTPTIIILIS